MAPKTLKILHAPVNVGNQPWVLSRHERKLGARSDLVLNYNTWINYKADRVLGTYGNGNWREFLRRAAFGFAAPFVYDVLHCYFGRSLLFWDDLGSWNRFPFADIKLAKSLGKKVFMTLQGCDVRLAGESHRRNRFTPCSQDACNAFVNCVNTFDQQRRRMIEDILPLCDRVFFLNPELGHFLPRGDFMPYASVEVDRIPVLPPKAKGVARIVHAPSDGSIKGTGLVTEALDELRRDFDFELVLVKNKTHEEAMTLYRSADIAIDQVLAGWYGGFAVEMMAMGKPVMCYIREQDRGFLPESLIGDLPILNVRPDRLKEDIAVVLENRHQWQEWSRASRAYVLKWHHPLRIATMLMTIYQNPAEPFCLECVERQESR